MRVAWLTDIHLDFLTADAITELGERVASSGCDAALLTGDLSVAPALPAHLGRLVAAIARPTFFVLGNHDFYGGSVDTVRSRARELGALDERLRWLGGGGVVPLSKSTALVGVDGWGDARFGRPETTPVILNDHLHITDLIAPSRAALISRVRSLADGDARRLEALLDEALARFPRVIVATHVPPFAEACLYEGKQSDDDWLPWFACKATGEVLMNRAAAHPKKAILVLAGHMHERCTIHPLPNLEVRVGAAEYGAPRIEDLLEIA